MTWMHPGLASMTSASIHRSSDEGGRVEGLARRSVWWQPTTETPASPGILLRQILKMGTADDYIAAREH